MKSIISTPHAPKAVGPYSQAVLTDAPYYLEISGQIGVHPDTGKLVEGGIEAETRQSLENVKAILTTVGWDFSNLIKVRIFITDMANYAKVNEIYASYFNSDFPARIAIAVKQLPINCLIEIDATAVGDSISE